MISCNVLLWPLKSHLHLHHSTAQHSDSGSLQVTDNNNNRKEVQRVQGQEGEPRHAAPQVHFEVQQAVTFAS